MAMTNSALFIRVYVFPLSTSIGDGGIDRVVKPNSTQFRTSGKFLKWKSCGGTNDFDSTSKMLK